MWSDAKGSGWIALHPAPSVVRAEGGVGGAARGSSSMWFNTRKWGSWRLAYLLARLQRDLWNCSSAGSGGSSSSGSSSSRATTTTTTTTATTASGSSGILRGKRAASAGPALSSQSAAQSPSTEQGAAGSGISGRGRGRPPNTSNNNNKGNNSNNNNDNNKGNNNSNSNNNNKSNNNSNNNSNSAQADAPRRGRGRPRGSGRVSGQVAEGNGAEDPSAANQESDQPKKSHRVEPTAEEEEDFEFEPQPVSPGEAGDEDPDDFWGKPIRKRPPPDPPPGESGTRQKVTVAVSCKSDLLSTSPEGLRDFVEAKGWQAIAVPRWEGERWLKLLLDSASGEVSKDELVEQIWQKHRRQESANLPGRRATPLRPSQAEAAPKAPQESQKPAWRDPTPPAQARPGCTCGLPIHAEKCRLFRPCSMPTPGPSRRTEARAADRSPELYFLFFFKKQQN
ncbi:unnamed protein product [Polarella glacialis]|uniref:Uncharacterized protein n=1 Tax=Polarella glacialis TaxID=89957 RepID=A0A813GW13_POLGL|nr:unnamed protein product [Polarella glacialis]